MGVWIETYTGSRRLQGAICHTLRGCVDWNISQQQLQIWDVSHPAWVCGLKLKRLLVEILSDRSHPAWVCGLKLLSHGFYLSTICHTLRGCVDWNRINGASFLTSAMSHPAWVCGLKLYLCLPILIAFGSHTLRGCVDWNRYSFLCLRKTSVTPCVGVWIETSIRKRYMLKHLVTPCVGVWIETPVPDFPNFCLCHTLRGCVDWNTRITGINCGKCRHTLRGCVDWNIHTTTESKPATPVTPCVGVWIETS